MKKPEGYVRFLSTPTSRSSTGVVGVYLMHNGSYQARFCYNKKEVILLCTFDFEEACDARRKAEEAQLRLREKFDINDYIKNNDTVSDKVLYNKFRNILLNNKNKNIKLLNRLKNNWEFEVNLNLKTGEKLNLLCSINESEKKGCTIKNKY